RRVRAEGRTRPGDDARRHRRRRGLVAHAERARPDDGRGNVRRADDEARRVPEGHRHHRRVRERDRRADAAVFAERDVLRRRARGRPGQTRHGGDRVGAQDDGRARAGSLMDVRFVVQNVLGGLAYGSLLFLIASGLTLVFGLMRIINLAQTAFYLLGAYVGLTLVAHGSNFWLASAAAGVLAMVLGLAVYSAFLHRYHADPLTSLLLTLGFALILDDGVRAIWGGGPHSIAAPPGLAGSLPFGTLVFPVYWLAVIAISVLIAVVLFVGLQRTMLGVMIRAAVDDEEMAR